MQQNRRLLHGTGQDQSRKRIFLGIPLGKAAGHSRSETVPQQEYRQAGMLLPDLLLNHSDRIQHIVPPGCIVELSSGEVGIVIASDADNRLHPKVVLVLDSNKNPVRKTVIDLKSLDQNQRKHYHIKQVIRDGTYGVSLEAFTANTTFAPA